MHAFVALGYTKYVVLNHILNEINLHPSCVVGFYLNGIPCHDVP